MYIKTGNKYRKASVNEVLEQASAYVQEHQSMVGTVIKSPADTEKFLKDALGNLQKEKFSIMFLDNRHRVLAFETMFEGTIDGTSVYPREVVKRSLELNAAAVIFSHNHPSGVAEPSQADERITKRLKEALDLVDVRVLDHIVVGGSNHTSLASRGML